MSEQRAFPRRRVLKAGTIEFGVGGYDCTIRNLSESGAALELIAPIKVPDTFELTVRGDGLRRMCGVIWRRDRRVGVLFV
jgi:PilZ domain